LGMRLNIERQRFLYKLDFVHVLWARARECLFLRLTNRPWDDWFGSILVIC
jgi:hypothetical protein